MLKVMAVSDEDMEDWERNDTANGVPFYVHQSTEHTQWDHPLLSNVLEELNGYNSIKYAAYRMAIKLRTLQKCLMWCHVDHIVIKSSFNELDQLIESSNPSAPTECQVEIKQIEKIANECLVKALRNRSTNAQIQLYTELSLNILLNIYDRRRRGKLRVQVPKLFFTILSSAKLQEKLKYIIKQYSNQHGVVETKQLVQLLNDLTQISVFLYESPSFGLHFIPAALETCILSSGEAVKEEYLLQWFLQEPQNLVWLSTLNRLTISDNVQHLNKCSICKMFPIVGLRYRCLRCLNYNICQHCFFNGQTNKTHLSNHPLQEYCLPSTKKDDLKAVISTFKNKLTRKTLLQSKRGYLCLPFHHVSNEINLNYHLNQEIRRQNSGSTCSGSVSRDSQTDGEPMDAIGNRKELEIIAIQLEDELKYLQQEVDRLCNGFEQDERDDDNEERANKKRNSSARQNAICLLKQELLEDHNHQLQLLLNRLRALLKQKDVTLDGNETVYQKVQTINDCLNRLKSTPLNEENAIDSFKFFSPIYAAQKMTNLQRWKQQNLVQGQSAQSNKFITRIQLDNHSSCNNHTSTIAQEREEDLSISSLIPKLYSIAETKQTTETTNRDLNMSELISALQSIAEEKQSGINNIDFQSEIGEPSTSNVNSTTNNTNETNEATVMVETQPIVEDSGVTVSFSMGEMTDNTLMRTVEGLRHSSHLRTNHSADIVDKSSNIFTSSCFLTPEPSSSSKEEVTDNSLELKVLDEVLDKLREFIPEQTPGIKNRWCPQEQNKLFHIACNIENILDDVQTSNIVNSEESSIIS